MNPIIRIDPGVGGLTKIPLKKSGIIPISGRLTTPKRGASRIKSIGSNLLTYDYFFTLALFTVLFSSGLMTF